MELQRVGKVDKGAKLYWWGNGGGMRVARPTLCGERGENDA